MMRSFHYLNNMLQKNKFILFWIKQPMHVAEVFGKINGFPSKAMSLKSHVLQSVNIINVFQAFINCL